MTWKPERPALTGIGGAILRIRHQETGNVVELRGETAAVEQLADLVEGGEQARVERLRQISTGLIGYYLVVIVDGGFSSIAVQVPAPGITSIEHVGRLQAELTRSAGKPVLIVSWTPLEVPRQITVAQVVPSSAEVPGLHPS